MGDASCLDMLCGAGGASMLLMVCTVLAVSPSHPQPLLPLSLPAQISVVPPPWQYLPLSQAELGPLFSNSSPFSFSQSLLMVPPPGHVSRPELRASFGPYAVTQVISDPVLPLSPPLSASLLSGHVERERDEGGQERYRVRALFHMRGERSAGGTCVTLHAFRETEEQKASCITQPPLGLCTVTLTLPSEWFEAEQTLPGWDKRFRHTRRRHRMLNRERHRVGRRYRSFSGNRWRRKAFINRRTSVAGAPPTSLRYRAGVEGDGGAPGALRYQRGPMADQIQLYYSSFGTVPDLKLTLARCVEDTLPQSQRQLFYIRAVTLREEKKEDRNWTKEEETCLHAQEETELSLDSNVLIRYNSGPVQTGQPIGVSVNLRANFSAEFVVIRLQVKKGLVSLVAQRTLTSDLWAVTLERSQASKHDFISIICHKHGPLKHTHNPSLLQQVVCLSVDGLRRSFGVAMTVSANWWVEYSGRKNHLSPHGAAMSTFSFADRHIVGIAPITESDTIINTAILTSDPVSLPVIVAAVSHDGTVSDVTAAVRCQTTNENIVKVSSDCSTLFVDGSESGVGSTCVVVEFLLGMLSGSVCLAVWVPSVPLRVSLSDPVLNAIDGWNYFSEHECSPVFQRSTVQVLTQFIAQDSQSKTTHLMRSSDWFVDVTELTRNWLRVENPGVASLDPQNNLVGLQPGRTSLHVISEQWDGVLGSCDVTVTSDPVTAGDLSVQVVSNLGMSIMASPAHPSVLTTTVTAYNILYNHEQEATISVWLQFSDDTAALLDSFSDIPFFLRLSSLAETVVMVMPGPTQRIVAQGDGGGPLLRAELLVSTCSDQPITSNSIAEKDWEENGDGVGVGTRRLARGSGWIRVNLDLLDPLGSEVGEGDEFVFDISDMLVESDGDVYTSNFDDDTEDVLNGRNATASDYYDRSVQNAADRGWKNGEKRGIVSRNNLERAVLMPSHEESAVYFSPSQEKEGRWAEEGQKEEKREGNEEVEVGLGAVLSLICLSTILFLANCLPCALRERRRRKTVEGENDKGEMEGDTDQMKEEEEWKKTEKGGKEGEEEEKNEEEEEEEDKEREKMKKMAAKEVEIIC